MRLHIISCLFSYASCRLRSRKCRLLFIIISSISWPLASWLLITLCLQEDYQLFHYPPNVNLYQIYEKEKSQINVNIPPLWKIIFPLSSNYTEYCLVRSHKCNNHKNSNRNSSSLLWSPCRTADIIFVIRSHIMNFDQRDAIRQTWGNRQCYENFGFFIRILFILGKQTSNNNNARKYLLKDSIQNQNLYFDHSSGSTLEKLHYEQLVHRDIIQFDFTDSNSNLVNKWIASIDFIVKYCSTNENSFTLLIDDDYFIHPINLLQLLKRITPTQYRLYASGQVQHASYPVRVPFIYRYISLSNYPFNMYPPYLFGGNNHIKYACCSLIACWVCICF
uniref:Hexosyltransferase n=2 Tax=Schistosoma japonicum TaxID=6182 RepID=Q86FC8_SCHJA|nr:similar to GenBank Accession Number AB041415 UDP-Gal:GlcNAc beta1,3-galactosyltransferase 5 in Pan paniscus [Schistosoma japonicum]